MSAGAAARVRAAFADAGVRGALHAVDLADGGREVAVGADERVVLASVFKVVLIAELAARVADGSVDPARAVTLEPGARTAGSAGVAAMRDPVTMSLRDLAHLAIAVSDLAAADALYDLLGGDAALNARCASMGLRDTTIRGCSRDIMALIAGGAPGGLDPARTGTSTPRDMTRLLTALWAEGEGDRFALVREAMAMQVWPHRLASGFPFDDVRVSGKTGTAPGARNEVGVVEYPDGGRFAVAVFTTTDNPAMTLPQADAVIGRAARMAVDALRGGG